jgi:hypothetical protein
MDSIRDYLSEKQFKGSEVMQSAMMFLLSVFLIGGGVIIINDEDIFKKIYEGYQSPPAVSNSWTADLPDDLSLAALQRNISNLRKKSDFNIAIAAIMIIIGSIISIYQIYKLFFS